MLPEFSHASGPSRALTGLALLLVVSGCSTSPSGAGDDPDFTPVFTSGEDGYHTYRIPSVVRGSGEVLLAFAEGRVDSHFDKSMNDIVLRRSFDGGISWGALQVLHDAGEPSLNDPTPVYVADGPHAGRVILMYEQIPCRSTSIQDCPPLAGESRVSFMMLSDDDGETWSAPIDVTAEVTLAGTDTAGVGPGIGIQKTFEPHAGRLVFPFRGPGAANYAVYSDDGGDTWTVSDVADASMTVGAGNEVQIAELSDGSLVMNMRNTEDTGFRKISRSADGGQTWSSITDDDELVDGMVMAAILRFSAASGDDRDRDRLLFSNPVHPFRLEGTIRLSYDDGETWPVAREIWPGVFSYSGLVRLDCGNVGILFEEGINTAQILFAPVSIRWLTDGADDPSCL